jgi:hypothetical protein
MITENNWASRKVMAADATAVLRFRRTSARARIGWRTFVDEIRSSKRRIGSRSPVKPTGAAQHA